MFEGLGAHTPLGRQCISHVLVAIAVLDSSSLTVHQKSCKSTFVDEILGSSSSSLVLQFGGQVSIIFAILLPSFVDISLLHIDLIVCVVDLFVGLLCIA